MSLSADIIEECFSSFDKKGQGFLEKEQIGMVIRALGKNPTEKELKAIIDELGGQKFDIARLKTVLKNSKIRGPQEMEKDVRDAFRALDKDSKGTVAEAELRLILGSLGDALTTQEVNALLANFKSDDGNLDYTEFVNQIINAYPASEHKGRS